jgi:geranylgeranyl diphosphate synthase type 3
MAAQPHQQEHAIDESCLEPFKYLTQIPGKDVRGLLIDCFQSWLEIPEDKLIGIKDIIASLHNASLLVDDIEDNSKLRRGVPVAHHIYGIANTINCANYVYCLALEKCHLLNSPQAMQVFVQELLNLHRGQGQDILWRDQHVCPTEEQYKGMVIDKTGGLFRLAVGLMQAFSCNHNANTDFRPLLDVLALYFQIRDDMLNVSR